MKRALFSLLFIVVFKSVLTAQKTDIVEDRRLLGYGIRAGFMRSSINDLETTILSEPYFVNYTMRAQPRSGWTAGMFINYRFLNNLLGIHSEIAYAQQGSDLLFNNIEKDFNYKMQFHYQYINVSSLFKVYPLHYAPSSYPEQAWKDGFNIGAGPQLGFNIAPQNIIYTSGGSGRLAAFGSDLEQQQQLRNVLKGKTNLGVTLGVGYDFYNIGLTIDARYFFGVADVVETQANSYNFIENKNTNKAIQFTIGWDFSRFNYTKRY